MIFLFVLSFAVMISILWESAEFAGKVAGESHKDTMTDLIAGLAGALVIASYAGLRNDLMKSGKLSIWY
ncbi:hypothetical protein [Domibacillus robiginosus]|uniref:hypothetical protein n=1 Tax=Domibacillus robiginosus TaxID=1071054 RepID=UPI000B05600B|nr:hypothetical protein [Domibacillus robiginosus]